VKFVVNFFIHLRKTDKVSKTLQEGNFSFFFFENHKKEFVKIRIIRGNLFFITLIANLQGFENLAGRKKPQYLSTSES